MQPKLLPASNIMRQLHIKSTHAPGQGNSVEAKVPMNNRTIDASGDAAASSETGGAVLPRLLLPVLLVYGRNTLQQTTEWIDDRNFYEPILLIVSINSGGDPNRTLSSINGEVSRRARARDEPAREGVIKTPYLAVCQWKPESAWLAK